MKLDNLKWNWPHLYKTLMCNMTQETGFIFYWVVICQIYTEILYDQLLEVNSYPSLFSFQTICKQKSLQGCWNILCMSTWWYIWLERNRRACHASFRNLDDIISNVKHNWLKWSTITSVGCERNFSVFKFAWKMQFINFIIIILTL